MSDTMWKLHKAKELADKMMFEASRARSLLDDAFGGWVDHVATTNEAHNVSFGNKRMKTRRG